MKASTKPMKLALFTVLAALTTLQVACTDREVAAGAAGAVIGAILVDSAEALDITEIAQMYQLQPESASKLIVALDQAQKAQDDATAAAAWAQIGVDLQEARNIGTSGSLSPESIDRIARTLDQDVTATSTMVNGILATARQLQAEKNQNQNLN